MTNIERKALELVNEVRRERNQELWKDVGNRKGYGMALETLCRAIERHEAFRQEVSDAVTAFMMDKPGLSGAGITRFIITKPDPLVEVLADMGLKSKGGYDWASEFRSTLARRGLEIREKTND